MNRAIRNTLNTCVLALNVLLGAALLVTAYSGYVNPLERPLMGVLPLTFPGWLAATAVMLVADLIWWRKTSLIAIGCILAAWPMVWNTCPFNISSGIPRGTSPDRVFTVMSYNVCQMKNFRGGYPGGVNPTVSYILSQDADIVCLQEMNYFEPVEQFHFTQAQLDSLQSKYPYIMLGAHGVVTLSRYPLRNIHLDINSRRRGGWCDMGAWEVDVEGRRLALFSLHLQSFSFTKEDKAEYLSLTRLEKKENLGELRGSLIGKLEKAAVHRADQAQMLSRYIEYYGGENVIVCGDFNDVPGCYTLHCLADCGMKEVWPEVAFGPTYTYFDNRFYFRIDHMLWRGRLRPAGIRRGNVRYSDHAPLIATFVWDEDSKTENKR